MRTVLPISMAALLLIQAVSGSCWQPTRACIGLETARGVASTHSCCETGCEDEGEGNSTEGPCGCDLECSGICTYLGSEKIDFDSAQLIVAFAHALVQSALADSQSVPTNWTQILCGTSEIEPPLRLHLLHQTLLI